MMAGTRFFRHLPGNYLYLHHARGNSLDPDSQKRIPAVYIEKNKKTGEIMFFSILLMPGIDLYVHLKSLT
jgi:hypothetical protein